MPAGYRPDGAPFWGESVPVQIAVNIAGTPLGDTYDAVIATRGTNSGATDHAPMVAGSAFSAWMDPTMRYLLDGDTPTITWVIEVLAGAGTLHLHDGRSSAGDTPTGLPPNDLGTRTVTGPGTYLWPSTSTVDDLLGDDYSRPWVQLQCTSGAVDVQQVKLRVWPAGGPLGGLDGHVDATTPTWDAASRARYEWQYSDTVSGSDYDSTWYAAWAAMQSDAATHPAQGDPFPAFSSATNVASFYGTRSGVNFEGTLFTTVVESQTGDVFLIRASDEDLLNRRNNALTGDEGVDYIADPGEVWIDPVAYAVLDEPIEVTWDLVMDYPGSTALTAEQEAAGQVLTHTVVSLIDSNDHFELFSVYPEAGPVISSVTLNQYREGDPAAGESQSFPLPVPSHVFRLRVQARHQYQAGSIPAPHGVNYFGGSRSAEAGMNGILRATHMTGTEFSPPGYYFTRPGFRFWVPGPATTEPVRYARLLHRGDGNGMSTRRLVSGRNTHQTGRLRGSF